METQSESNNTNPYDINNLEIPQSSIKINAKSFSINGQRYDSGSFCLVHNEQPNQPPHVVLINRPRLNDQPSHFSALPFVRPESLPISVPNYNFKPNELIIIKKAGIFPQNRVIDKCFVLPFEQAAKGAPAGSDGKFIFLVNLEYNEAKGAVMEIKDFKKFAPKDCPRAFKPPMKPQTTQFPSGNARQLAPGYAHPAPLPQHPGMGGSYRPPAPMPPGLGKIPDGLRIKSSREQQPIETNEDTKHHYQKITKTLGLIPDEIKNKFPQNQSGEIVWYPTPPVNISLTWHRRKHGPKHSLKYLKYLQNKKEANQGQRGLNVNDDQTTVQSN